MSAEQPFAYAADLYWRAGWRPIPLPWGKKEPPPHGFTGASGVTPSYADIMAWTEGPEASGNIALRMPPDVIGIDVDAYGGKRGAATLLDAAARWGELPVAPMSSARDDGVSGIRFYRVPPGMRWPGEVGPDVEIIQARHRYAVVWPSVHPTAARYRWVGDLVPGVDDCPEMPEAWIAGLTGGAWAVDVPKASLGGGVVDAWLADNGGDPCRAVTSARDAAVEALSASQGSRHDRATRSVMRLAHMAAEGHLGAATAIVEDLWAAFAHAITLDGSRTDDQARAEWGRIVAGAIAVVLAYPQRADLPDPCGWQLSGLIAPGEVPLTLERRTTVAPTLSLIRGGGDQGEDDEAPETVWTDVAGLLAAGLPDPPPPDVMQRRDGVGLFYAGKVNVIFGDPESGKSWLAYAAVVEAIGEARAAAILDLDHNGVTAILGRLRLLGADDDALGKFLRLAEPDDRLALAACIHDLTADPATVVVVDSLGEVLPMLNLSSNSPDDYTTAHRAVLTPLAAAGACVIAIDHLPKDTEARKSGQTGTLAKRRAVSGVTLLVAADENEAFAPGKGGVAHLTIFKDRPGGLRASSPAGRRAPAGTFVMQPADPVEPLGRLAWWVAAPTAADLVNLVPGKLLDRALALDPPPESATDLAKRGKMRKADACRVYDYWEREYGRSEGAV